MIFCSLSDRSIIIFIMLNSLCIAFDGMRKSCQSSLSSNPILHHHNIEWRICQSSRQRWWATNLWQHHYSSYDNPPWRGSIYSTNSPNWFLCVSLSWKLPLPPEFHLPLPCWLSKSMSHTHAYHTRSFLSTDNTKWSSSSPSFLTIVSVGIKHLASK